MSKLKIRNGSTWEEIPAGGVGVPSGGTAGQLLMKSSSTDYADEWADISEAGAMNQWELLWTNASPDSAFAPQTISLALSGYDACAILFHTPGKSYDAGSPITAIFLKGIKGLACVNSYQLWYRAATMQDTGVVFNAGYQSNTINQPPALVDEVMVPMYIYGIKGVNS